jgi:hypothetical protein
MMLFVSSATSWTIAVFSFILRCFAFSLLDWIQTETYHKFSFKFKNSESVVVNEEYKHSRSCKR